MHVFRFLLLFLLLVTSPFFAVNAQEIERNVSIRILAERGAVGAEDDIWIGIEQSIRPHWHTYWVNPGDSGAASKVTWDLPDGFSVSEISWPAPKKLPFGPLLNYGYEDHAILLQKLRVPKNLPEGEIVLKASVETLVCKEECIPEFDELSLTLNGAGALEEDNTDYLARARTLLPQPYDVGAQFYSEEDNFVVSLPVDEALLQGVDLDDVALYPYAWGLVDNVAAPDVSSEAGNLMIAQKLGDRDFSALEQAAFVVSFGDGRAIEVQAQRVSAGEANAAEASHGMDLSQATRADDSVSVTWLQAALLALLGGLVLNLMPCVFPVLSMKALSLVKMSEKERSVARGHGIAYTFGVVLSFLAIALVLIALKSAGEQIGWGFQLQNPLVVSVLMYLLFVVGLNLSGFFEFGAGLSNVGGKLTQKQGVSGSFFTGMLATMVAAPCTAPFMGTAISFALAQPSVIGLSIFALLGFGLALPYLLLSFIPALQRFMPKPGAWMDVFKQFLAFPMFASVAWLVWVLSQQTGAPGVLGAGMGLVLIAFALWLFKVAPKGGGKRIFVIVVALLSLLLSVLVVPRDVVAPVEGAAQVKSAEEMSLAYSEDMLEEALASDDPVFVEMTAAWCISCKFNHKTSIGIRATETIMEKRGVIYLVGDWTNQDPVITKYLAEYGRNGVPLYVYYGRPNEDGNRPEPVVLPQILTPGIIAEYLDK